MSQRICAVVVTHNRLTFLETCIAALRAQTRALDGILVVDNDSGADTQTWLAAQTDLSVIRQANLGPGGGMATGLALATEWGFDWIWCLDDDACPTPNALDALVRAVAARPDARVFNSLGVSLDNPAQFPAGALCVRTDAQNFLQGQNIYRVADAQNYADAHGLVDTVGGQFYYGTLVHRCVVESIGAPLAWLFWRGDEVEYGLRIMRAGFHIYVVLDSVVTHPAAAIAFVTLFGKTFPYERLRAAPRYYNIRNSIYLREAYYKNRPFTFYVLRRALAALFVELMVDHQRSWRAKSEGCAAVARGVWDGLVIVRRSRHAAALGPVTGDG